jgi:hypothetical protein
VGGEPRRTPFHVPQGGLLQPAPRLPSGWYAASGILLQAVQGGGPIAATEHASPCGRAGATPNALPALWLPQHSADRPSAWIAQRPLLLQPLRQHDAGAEKACAQATFRAVAR